ncbi:transposable element Tcb1 transposase [Trichonephila clavipes]|nr:transposable element Tcb1 transposase [Trichonephila clavipes]
MISEDDHSGIASGREEGEGHIWRRSVQRVHLFAVQTQTFNIKEKDRYGAHGAVVWGGIMLNGWTELRVGSVIGDRYPKEAILFLVRLFRSTSFSWMDNAQPDGTTDVQQLLESETITRKGWPTFTPDLNKTKHSVLVLWGLLAAR